MRAADNKEAFDANVKKMKDTAKWAIGLGSAMIIGVVSILFYHFVFAHRCDVENIIVNSITGQQSLESIYDSCLSDFDIEKVLSELQLLDSKPGNCR